MKTIALASLLGIAFGAGPVAASNGFNLIGFGTRSSAMGGADLAVVRDTLALNVNPAGLASVDHHGDVWLGFLDGRNIRHRDSLGNDIPFARGTVVAGSVGWAHRLDDRPWTLGAGIFTQGGAGSDFRGLTTAFGSRDSLESTFGLAKLSLGAARKGARWDLGASVALSWAELDLSLFPTTSYVPTQGVAGPPVTFFGLRLEGAADRRLGLKLGVNFRPVSRWTVAATYTSALDLDLDGGRLTVDYTALGLGPVEYGEAGFGGIGFPREVGIGFGCAVTQTLELAAEATWLGWSSTNRRSRLVGSAPSSASAPPELEVVGALDWRDQWVLAVGFSWSVTGRTTLLGGYNYGRNPIPDRTLTPLFPTIGEHHVGLGMERRLAGGRSLGVGLTYQMENEVTYENPALPFGAATIEVEVLDLHVTVGFGGPVRGDHDGR